METSFLPEQPSVAGLVQRIATELDAKAVMLLHESGQVLHRSGWVGEEHYPSMAALVAAMIAAGKSLGGMEDGFSGEPGRLSCDSDLMGLYTVAVTGGIWLAVLYEQPLNPGLFRMKVRRYCAFLAQLGVRRPRQWEATEHDDTEDNMRPAHRQEIITPAKPTLFGDISDEEIDELFEGARS